MVTVVSCFGYNHFSASKCYLMKRFHYFLFVAREVMPLLELLRALEIRRRGRVYISWLSVRRRLQVLIRDVNPNRRFDRLGQMLVDGKR